MQSFFYTNFCTSSLAIASNLIIFERMKKLAVSIVLLFSIISVFSCQDEFCVDNTTPQLIIRFYDKDSTPATKALSMVVSANNLDTLFDGITTDSIAVPLDTQQETVTYKISIFDSINTQEELIINYNVEDIYVSKACGFKSVFRNFTFTSTNNSWITDSKQLTSEITNENSAHVQIFH